ncbi:MAG: hypothetical protein DBW62_04485 [Microbacterium sp.]|nr:MAG: hypothetical protein DBW62_04485 [Microbacterium sp.]
MDERSVAELFATLLAQTASKSDADARMYAALDNQGLLSRVTTHRYICRRGCPIATVYKVGAAVMLAVRDYKYSPGLNEAQSVESARAKNTLDGNRHWPAHVYDMTDLAEWGDDAGASIVCRHYRGVLTGKRVLEDSRDVAPGHPNKPTRL